ncbi:MAG TPA: G5 domain-containing protein [Dehalococcoidia bacterium]|nr:G5 domain-containing protein [Dehalococcoidia bacterium]
MPVPTAQEVSTEAALTSVLRTQAESVSGILVGVGRADNASLTLEAQSAPGAEIIPQPLLSAVARLSARGALGGDGPPLSVPLNAKTVSFTLHERGIASSQVTAYDTVGDALAAAGVELGQFDQVSPPPDEKLTAGMHVHVDYATRVHLVYGTEVQIIETQARSIREMFAEQAIDVEASDMVFPDGSKSVREGMTVKVILVRTALVYEDVPVPFRTSTRYDYGIPMGQKVVQTPGAEGAARKTYEAKTVNGREVGRVFVGEEVIEPTNEVVLLGAKQPTIVPVDNGGAAPGEGECRQRMVVWATYYTAASAGGTITRTGTGVYKGIIATDPNVIALGTRMWVPGYGYGIAADTGGGVIGAHIDLAYGENDVYDWGSRTVEICILG